MRIVDLPAAAAAAAVAAVAVVVAEAVVVVAFVVAAAAATSVDWASIERASPVVPSPVRHPRTPPSAESWPAAAS